MNELLIKLENLHFEKRLALLTEQLKGKKVIIYGMGLLFDTMLKNYNFANLNIIGISDRKITQAQEGNIIKGFYGIPLNSIKKYNPDCILLAALNYKPILEDFKRNLFKTSDFKIIPLAQNTLKMELKELLKDIDLSFLNPFNKLHTEISELRNILNLVTDVRNMPKACGIYRKIQLECTSLLQKVHTICEENNLHYWLDSGTLLGAYRHKGFVPWDDDIDICMRRQDYLKILPILKQKFQDSDFYIRERAETCKFYQIRIINKYDSRIGLDIFPVDDFSETSLTDKRKMDIDKKIKYARKFFEKKYPRKCMAGNKIQEAKQDIISIQNKIILNNKVCQEKNPALFFGIDFPYRIKGTLIYDYETIFPLKTLEFEGNLYYCPNKTERYLENLYGNYMQLPNMIKENYRKSISCLENVK